MNISLGGNGQVADHILFAMFPWRMKLHFHFTSWMSTASLTHAPRPLQRYQLMQLMRLRAQSVNEDCRMDTEPLNGKHPTTFGHRRVRVQETVYHHFVP